VRQDGDLPAAGRRSKDLSKSRVGLLTSERFSGIDAETSSGWPDGMDAADRRRARTQARVYPSREAHDRDDRAYWAALPVDVRVLEVWKLSEEQWRLRGEFPDEPGLCRSVARIHRP
jgi:hypothetical protein